MKPSKAPVYFQFPINPYPSECAAMLEAYEHDSQDLTYFHKKGTAADLDGIHTWRNAHTGDILITDGLKPQVRNEGWTLKPQTRTRENQWTSIGLMWQGKFLIHHWVLCDELTPEQCQEWENYRRTARAIRQAYLKRADQQSKPIQLEF